MVFNGSLSDSKSPQHSRTFLSILANLNHAEVWMVFTVPFISKSSGHWTNPLVIVPRAQITIRITVKFTFHSLFISHAKSGYLSFLSLAFNFTLWSAGTAHNSARSLFLLLLIIARSGCLAKITRSVCISKFQRSLCISLSRTDSELCVYQ